jgi:hypothetical protein
LLRDALVSCVGELEEFLTASEISLLSEHSYQDGTVKDLLNVGLDINPFAVIDGNSHFACRYTGHLIGSAVDAPHRGALNSFANMLEFRSRCVALKSGEMLVVDQRRALHGRLPLGSGQDQITTDRRRLMFLSFVRMHDNIEIKDANIDR